MTPHELADRIDLVAAELRKPGITRIRLSDAKHVAIALLNDIDRALSFGKPGDGLEELLGKKDGPFRLPRGYSNLEET